MSTDKQPPPTARLVGFHVRPEHPLPPPLQHVGAVNVDDPPGNLAGWGVHIRGATMFLESPPGWTTANHTNRNLWNPRGERTVIGPISLVHVTLKWQGASWEACEKLVQRFDLPEMRTARPAAADQAKPIDPKELGDP